MIYRAKDPARNYILKSIITKDEEVRQAFYDEYESLSQLNSPSLPLYYGIEEHFHYPDREGDYLTLCMEDCVYEHPFSLEYYSISEVVEILKETGEILLYLLNHGILYTDLNASNLLVRKEEEGWHVTLIDFTFCYYYMRNPHPAYSLKFSYNLSPSLKGHQLLIQELALLLQDLVMQSQEETLPSGLFFLLETGLHPTESLLLPDYLELLKKFTI